MVATNSAKRSARLSREDWIRGALDLLTTAGISGVKIVPLAERLGVTSGSFYWHFKNRQALCEAVLAYWEQQLTDTAIIAAKQFVGSPAERIWQLMERVMSTGMARYDLALWQWAQADTLAQSVFQRVLSKRFDAAEWMFREAGFDAPEAEARARLTVVYMMGESTLVPGTREQRLSALKIKYQVLTNPLVKLDLEEADQDDE